MTESPPDLVDDVRERADTFSETLEDLRKFRQSISEYRERVENMDANERDAFYQSAGGIRDHAVNATTPDELLALEDDIEEAVRSPLQQVAEESLIELIDLIEPELSEDVSTQTFEKLETKIPVELAEIATAYQELYKTVDDFPDILRQVLARFIENEPSVLQSPERDLKPTIDDLESRHETLARLETTLEESAGWVPTFNFTGQVRFYSDRSHELDVPRIESKLSDITAAVNTLAGGGIHVGDIASNKLESWYDTGNLSYLMPTLIDIQDNVSSAAEKYEDVADSMTDFEDYDASNGVFQAELDDLQTSYTQLELYDYSSFENIEESLTDVDEQVQSFIDQLHKRLKAQKDLVDELDVAEGESPPEVQLGAPGAPLLPMHVEDNPMQALEDCNALHDWITTHLEADSESIDQEEMLEVWQSLSGGEKVELTEENREKVLALADRLPLSVILSGT